jgi:hypothetical protein
MVGINYNSYIASTGIGEKMASNISICTSMKKDGTYSSMVRVEKI